MSMICGLLGLSPAQIAALRATPALASDLVITVARLRLLPMSQLPPSVSQLPPEMRQAAEAKLRAALEQTLRPEEAAARARVERLGPLEEAISLEKSWHMLHYLFTGHMWEDVPAPGNQLVTGEDIGEDMGYGPARLHEPKATQEFARFLQTQDVSRLQERVNYREMASLQVYGMPMGHGNDAEHQTDLRQEVGLYFPKLRDYVVKMADKQYGLLIWVT
jgi:hypothetical protein